MAGHATLRSATLADLVRPGTVRPASEPDPFGSDRLLPVLPELSELLPGRGLRRGSTVAVMASPPMETDVRMPPGGRAEMGGRVLSGGGVSAVPAGGRAEAGGGVASGSASLVLALIAAASRAGSWCALVGVPTFGALAAADMGIALDRLALVPNPGPDWPTVVAALIDGVDVVVIAAPGVASASIASRLAARARQRGTVLVPYGRWEGADVTLRVVRGEWEGLGQGQGRLRRRQVVIAARGRGAASRPKEITLWMPGGDGRAMAAVAEPAPRRRATLTLVRAS